jgi:hypothetical protein
MDLIYRMPEGEKSRNDCSRTGAEDQIESLVQATVEHRLDFFEDAERVEALCTTPIKREDSAEAVRLIDSRQVFVFHGANHK